MACRRTTRGWSYLSPGHLVLGYVEDCVTPTKNSRTAALQELRIGRITGSHLVLRHIEGQFFECIVFGHLCPHCFGFEDLAVVVFNVLSLKGCIVVGIISD
jgi:hypothetical protein